jgi:hypothetical protein
MFRVRVPKLQTEENVSFGLFLVHVPRLASMGVLDIFHYLAALPKGEAEINFCQT